MKRPVAPESTRASTDLTSPVSVVSTLTFRFRDWGENSSGPFSAATTSCAGRCLSQRGQGFDFGGGFPKGCTTWTVSADSSIPVTLYTGRIENRLLVDNEGVLFTRCFFENPPRPWVRAPWKRRPRSGLVLPLRRPAEQAYPPGAPEGHPPSAYGHQQAPGSPFRNVPASRSGSRSGAWRASFEACRHPSGLDFWGSGCCARSAGVETG